jgi:branched-chain amino acid aminotransferase
VNAVLPKFVWLDGDLVDWADATVHVTTGGLHYGVGFFEGIRCHGTGRGPALFRLDDHLHRLRRSAAIYGVTLRYDGAALADACRQVVSRNGLSDCYVRPLVFLGAAANPMAADFRYAVIASPQPPLANGQHEVATAQVSAFQRYAANALPPAAKASGQYLNAYLAQREALRCGHDEALLLNEHGYLADGWAHNVFVVSDRYLVTSPLWTGGLPGITRDSVLRLAEDHGVAVLERPLTRSDVYLADECFLTGTAVGIRPVVSVDGRVIGDGGPGALTLQIAEWLTAVTTGTTEAHPEWRQYVT